MSWEVVLKHSADEINMRNLREYIKKDTDKAKALRYMYNKWKAKDYDKKSKDYDSIRMFVRGLDDFGTMGWEL